MNRKDRVDQIHIFVHNADSTSSWEANKIVRALAPECLQQPTAPSIAMHNVPGQWPRDMYSYAYGYLMQQGIALSEDCFGESGSSFGKSIYVVYVRGPNARNSAESSPPAQHLAHSSAPPVAGDVSPLHIQPYSLQFTMALMLGVGGAVVLGIVFAIVEILGTKSSAPAASMSSAMSSASAMSMAPSVPYSPRPAFRVTSVPFEEAMIVRFPEELDNLLAKKSFGLAVHNLRVDKRNLVSPDTLAYAFPSRVNKLEAMVVNGVRGEDYDSVSFPCFLPDGVIAYLAKSKDKSLSIHNGVSKGEYDDVHIPLWFGFEAHRDMIVRSGCGPDGSLVFSAGVGKRQFLVIDDKNGPMFDEVGPITFGSDRRVAYAGRQGKHWSAVINDKVGSAFDKIGEISFGPGGSVAYAAQRGTRWLMVVDDKQGELYDQVSHPVFNSDGELAYVAKKGPDSFLVVGGEARGPYADIGSIAFDHANQLVYSVKEDRQWRITDGGEVMGPKFDEIYALSVADDSTVSYVGRRGQSRSVVRGDVVGPQFDDVRNISGENTGIAFGYAAKLNGKWQVVANNATGPMFDAVDLLFSGPKAVPVYAAKQGTKWSVMVGEQRSPSFDSVWVYGFDQSGTRLVYGAMNKREMWRKVMTIQ